VWGDALAAGRAKRAPELGELDVTVGAPVAFTEDPREANRFLGLVRAQLALYIGGMGARGKNFYNDLARRYGYEEAAETVQALYLDGRKAEAADAVPIELAAAVSLIGSRAAIKERLEALAAAGVNTIKAHLLAPAREQQLAAIEQLTGLTA
jgi:alkanesulfonate monooxygenase SsuD/methylene tetrahydromethanopterin reductase-like flavin-dependent oxidoreductase (luciferase family)